MADAARTLVKILLAIPLAILSAIVFVSAISSHSPSDILWLVVIGLGWLFIGAVDVSTQLTEILKELRKRP